MSIIFAAGKIFLKSKTTEKQTNKRSKSLAPPHSSDSTAVWHWTLDGQRMTIMLTKANNQIWCNGSIIDPKVDPGVGGITFTIPASTDNSSLSSSGHRKVHEVRIRRVSSSFSSSPTSSSSSSSAFPSSSSCSTLGIFAGGSVYRMTVDDVIIPEHTLAG